MDKLELTLMAHASAHRALLINLYAHRLLEEPDPVGAATILREMFASSATIPARNGHELDPATSDLLAAMTDEFIDDITNGIIEKVHYYTGIADPASAAQTSKQ